MWRQENISPNTKAEIAAPRPKFVAAWRALISRGYAGHLLAVVVLGTLAFSMQDILLEPYGGEILNLSVSATTVLTAVWVFGAVLGLALAAQGFHRRINPASFSALALLVGLLGFLQIIFSHPMNLPSLYFASLSF